MVVPIVVHGTAATTVTAMKDQTKKLPCMPRFLHKNKIPNFSGDSTNFQQTTQHENWLTNSKFPASNKQNKQGI